MCVGYPCGADVSLIQASPKRSEKYPRAIAPNHLRPAKKSIAKPVEKPPFSGDKPVENLGKSMGKWWKTILGINTLLITSLFFPRFSTDRERRYGIA